MRSLNQTLLVKSLFWFVCLDFGLLLSNVAMAGPTFVVNTFSDSNDSSLGDGRCSDSEGYCSLRAAIEEANALNNNANIELHNSKYEVYPINRAKGRLTILRSMSIKGSGMFLTAIDGQGNTGIFAIDGTYQPVVTIEKVSIQNGQDTYNGGTGFVVSQGAQLTLADSMVKSMESRAPGAGIFNSGIVRILRSSISYNRIPMEEGGGVFLSGGGIFNSATGGMYLTDSAVIYNQATRGGGIVNVGSMEILNSTISNNTVSKRGAGIMNSGYLSISFSTIAYNKAGTITAGSEPGYGGGIYSETDGQGISIGNSIIAANTQQFETYGSRYSPDCYTAPNTQAFVSHGGNVIGALTDNCTMQMALPGLSPDKVGKPGDILNPKLGQLKFNFGNIESIELLAGSPAIDQGTGEYTCPAKDQRGMNRPAGAACDAGAYEFGAQRPFPEPGRFYKVVSRYSNKCLDISGTTKENGATALQYDCTESAPDQKYSFSDLGDGSFSMKVMFSDKCLTVQDGSLNNGATIFQWDCTGQSQQRVRLEPTSNGTYTIRFNHSNKCMDLSGPTNANRQRVQQWECQGQSNQEWFLLGQ